MSKHAIIDASSVVVNIIEYDGDADFSLGEGFTLVDINDINPAPSIGWTYEVGVFSAPPTSALTKDELSAYANSKQWALATEGYVATLSGQPLTFATDATSYSLITGKALRLQQPDAPETTNWQFATGYIAVLSSDFIAASTKIADFMQATFDDLEPILEAIADGSITTVAEIDSATWPANHD